MSVKKFYATADTTIANAYKENLKQRGTEANMGLSDALEIFFIYGQTSNQNATTQDKLEESRILLKFDTDAIMEHYNNTFPTDDVKFILKLTNAVHPFTLARNYDIKAYALSESFIEGNGVDMDSYSDLGFSSWTNRDVATPWTKAGAVTGTETLIGTQRFESGEEDLEINVTSYIKSIFEGTVDNGIVVIMDESLTSGDRTQNYYTKKFYARSSEYFYKRPAIEARDSRTSSDDRGRLYKSSPLTPDNTQNLYLYNSVAGNRTDITGVVSLEFFEDSQFNTPVNISPVITKESTGVYKASFEVPSSINLTILHEKWTASFGDPLDTQVIKTGNVKLLTRQSESNSGNVKYVTNITNLKTSYTRQETAKFRVYTRQKDWNPTIYTVASKETENLIVEKMYYKIVRLVDEETVLDYGIGTEGTNNEHTLVSYDALGSYFDFDMSLLEKGYMYGIKLLFSVNGELREQEEIFKFRVD